MEEKRNDDIVELNTEETEQVVGGKMIRAPIERASPLNTVNPNSGIETLHEQVVKK